MPVEEGEVGGTPIDPAFLSFLKSVDGDMRTNEWCKAAAEYLVVHCFFA